MTVLTGRYHNAVTGVVNKLADLLVTTSTVPASAMVMIFNDTMTDDELSILRNAMKKSDTEQEEVYDTGEAIKKLKPISNDIWEYHKMGYVVGVTTNGVLKTNGELVMGAGVARQAVQYFADFKIKEVGGQANMPIAKRLGQMVATHGNKPYYLWQHRLISFPTKHHWRDNSDIDLIADSARKVMKWLDQGYIPTPIILPPPGCGMGGLTKAQVKPVLDEIFDERVMVLWGD